MAIVAGSLIVRPNRCVRIGRSCGRVLYIGVTERKSHVARIIEILERDGQILLLKRSRTKDHAAGEWETGSGGILSGETPQEATVREAKEETGLDVELVELFHVYSDPARDPRHHTASVVFLARAAGQPVGGDDAASCVVCPPDAPPAPLVFDHATIIADYLVYRRRGVRPPPRR